MPVSKTRVLPDERCNGQSEGHSIKDVKLPPVTKCGHEFRLGVEFYVEERLFEIQFYIPKVPWPLSVRGDLIKGFQAELRGLDASR
ncbi:hypothetical protein BpHYR1_016052 [Brachionus plicatilis]|uniref:Uncharacterized protein n=1 Tax=Brachionus plicatilis TaxID=10195 RepID=A0A3M7RRJ9_BRAPC|nr:hypothetical protein BpHYR1_016052 [Brachionus plicatilis]